MTNAAWKLKIASHIIIIEFLFAGISQDYLPVKIQAALQKKLITNLYN
jgi:hypothetical protein